MWHRTVASRSIALALIENEFLLASGFLAFLRLGNGCNELGTATILDNPLCRLPVLIQFPMPLRANIRGIQDRMFKERVIGAVSIITYNLFI